MNRIRKNSLFSILVLTITITFIFIGFKINIQAEEISLEEALNWGVEHNSSIKEIKDSIETIERSLNLIDTEYGFKTKISANPIIAGGSDKQTDDSSNGVDGGDSSSESSDGPKIQFKNYEIIS
jgi:hypothetical protein